MKIIIVFCNVHRRNIGIYFQYSFPVIIFIRREKNKNKTYYILQNNLFQNTLSSYKRFILFLHCFTCLFRHVSTWLRSLESINEKELLSSNKFHRYHFSRIVIQSYIEVAIIDHIFVNCEKTNFSCWIGNGAIFRAIVAYILIVH